MVRRLLLTLCVLLAFPASASADGHFGRLFTDLPAFTEPSTHKLSHLADSMLDPGGAARNNPAAPSIITYGGQFLDHDLTLDTTDTPTHQVVVRDIRNLRTPFLDLDSVYGKGRKENPELYSGKRLRVDSSNEFGVRDLPRIANGQAIIGDNRNDENRIIGQLHLAFLRAHNRLIRMGKSFKQARRTLRRHWQRIIVDEYLPAVAGKGKVRRFLRRNKVHHELYHQGKANPMMPIEFSVATFRFGHSEVRAEYEINEETGLVPVFSKTEPDLRGGSPLTPRLEIAWGEFVRQLAEPDDRNGINFTRHIDPLISESLFNLPIPGAANEGSNILAFRNMNRGKFYGLPSYESVARKMGVDPVDTGLSHKHGFHHGTPLWFGNLAESEQRKGGLLLGPVGGRIVTEVVLTCLARTPGNYLKARNFKLNPKIVGRDDRMTFSDLLLFAGVAELPEDDE